MNLPYMTAATGKNRKQIIAFAGLNYGQGAGDGELAESWGLSSARFPCLSQRDGRKTAGTTPAPRGCTHGEAVRGGRDRLSMTARWWAM